MWLTPYDIYSLLSKTCCGEDGLISFQIVRAKIVLKNARQAMRKIDEEIGSENQQITLKKTAPFKNGEGLRGNLSQS